MNDRKNYVDGQLLQELVGNQLTYYFKNGKVKATGGFVDGLMDGKWIFYRETGQLWQVGHFTLGKKNGSWIRYDEDDAIEYQEIFQDDRIVK